ncbi:glutathione S-transferase [Emcibacteraceae bacterium]|nr:glutathione S-transferase [Emcibacteraceae bacterium]
MNEFPILYSFRRCPYAMRARLVLLSCQIKCELREVVLRNKPQQMVNISPKATVPVLELVDGVIIDESCDIIIWAVKKNDPNQWQPHLKQMEELVKINDNQFKIHLDKYKYSSQNPELSKDVHRENCNFYLKLINEKLKGFNFLSADKQTVTDLSIFPFIRQFAFVDKDYFDKLPYPHLQKWLQYHLQSELFQNIMTKYDPWHEGQDIIYLP